MLIRLVAAAEDLTLLLTSLCSSLFSGSVIRKSMIKSSDMFSTFCSDICKNRVTDPAGSNPWIVLCSGTNFSVTSLLPGSNFNPFDEVSSSFTFGQLWLISHKNLLSLIASSSTKS